MKRLVQVVVIMSTIDFFTLNRQAVPLTQNLIVSNDHFLNFWYKKPKGDHGVLLETPKDRLVHSINDFMEWLVR